MSKQVQFRRGTALEHETFTGAIGEVTAVTDETELRVHDGVTRGGKSIGGRIFDSVSDMVGSSFRAGDLVKTRGYYAAGDGGGAEYLTMPNSYRTAYQYGDHTVSNGLVAYLQSEDRLILSKWGVRHGEEDGGERMISLLTWYRALAIDIDVYPGGALLSVVDRTITAGFLGDLVTNEFINLNNYIDIDLQGIRITRGSSFPATDDINGYLIGSNWMIWGSLRNFSFASQENCLWLENSNVDTGQVTIDNPSFNDCHNCMNTTMQSTICKVYNIQARHCSNILQMNTGDKFTIQHGWVSSRWNLPDDSALFTVELGVLEVSELIYVPGPQENSRLSIFHVKENGRRFHASKCRFGGEPGAFTLLRWEPDSEYNYNNPEPTPEAVGFTFSDCGILSSNYVGPADLDNGAPIIIKNIPNYMVVRGCGHLLENTILIEWVDAVPNEATILRYYNAPSRYLIDVRDSQSLSGATLPKDLLKIAVNPEYALVDEDSKVPTADGYKFTTPYTFTLGEASSTSQRFEVLLQGSQTIVGSTLYTFMKSFDILVANRWDGSSIVCRPEMVNTAEAGTDPKLVTVELFVFNMTEGTEYPVSMPTSGKYGDEIRIGFKVGGINSGALDSRQKGYVKNTGFTPTTREGSFFQLPNFDRE